MRLTQCLLDGFWFIRMVLCFQTTSGSLMSSVFSDRWTTHPERNAASIQKITQITHRAVFVFRTVKRRWATHWVSTRSGSGTRCLSHCFSFTHSFFVFRMVKRRWTSQARAKGPFLFVCLIQCHLKLGRLLVYSVCSSGCFRTVRRKWTTRTRVSAPSASCWSRTRGGRCWSSRS